MGFEVPTPVQAAVIPEILDGTEDIVGLAQTGTGKTAAFGLPLIQLLKERENRTLGLVLCPTRELCMQLTGEIQQYAVHVPGMSVTAVYGGTGIEQQIRALKKGSRIIAATPGRILDLIRRNACDISGIEYLILDEADIMLDMGFKDELDAILEAAPAERRTVLLSATMPKEIRQIAQHYMNNPREIVLGEKNAGIESVTHNYFFAPRRNKYAVLKRIVDYHPDVYGIVFCRTKRQTQEIADMMIKDGYNAEALHGDLSQTQREFVMKKFRERRLQLLVATDIAARGLDVDDLSHIFHYELPDQPAVYTHRSGRTGRAGKTGTSAAIISSKELSKIRRIEGVIKRKFERAEVPTGKQICAKQLISTMEKIRDTEVDEEQLSPYMEIIETMLSGLNRTELLKHIASLELNRFLQYYKDNPEIPADGGSRTSDSRGGPKSKGGKGSRKKKHQFTYMSVNLGKKHKVLPPELIGLVNRSTKNRNIEIGRIDIGPQSSRMEIENRFAGEVNAALNNFSYQGRRLRSEILSSGGKKKKNS